MHIRVLGRGAFGTVHQVVRVTDGQVFACKHMRLRQRGKNYRSGIHQEVQIMSLLHHRNIVRCVGAHEDSAEG